MKRLKARYTEPRINKSPIFIDVMNNFFLCLSMNESTSPSSLVEMQWSIHTGNGMDTLLRLVIQSESFHSVTILKLSIIANLRNIKNQILFEFQSPAK